MHRASVVITMTNNGNNPELTQNVLDEYADKAAPEYSQHASKFQNLERWTGDDPVMFVVDAAFSSTGLDYKEVVKPAAERFRQEFVESGDVSGLADLRSLKDNTAYTEKFGAGRPELVWKIADALLENEAADMDDLSVLQSWAENADPRDRDDPIRKLDGIGVATFQYLRMIAGANTVKPDIQVERFVEELDTAVPAFDFETDSKVDVLESCRRLADNSEYSLIEIDQIAWWYGTDTGTIEEAH